MIIIFYDPLGIVHKLRSRWGGPPHVVDYVTTTVREGVPPLPPHPHVVDYGNFFGRVLFSVGFGGYPPPLP